MEGPRHLQQSSLIRHPHALVHTLLARIAAHQRAPRRLLACLECGLARVAGHDAGECPACGYLGWRELGEPQVRQALPLLARDAR